MNIGRKAFSVGITATLLASLLATVVAPVTLGAVSITSVGAIPIDSTSTSTLTFTLSEELRAGWANGDASIVVEIRDNADVAPPAASVDAGTVQFSGTPTVSAPGSLEASASISSNQLTIKIKHSDTANFETISVSGLSIKASATAAIGPIQAWLINQAAVPGDLSNNDLFFSNSFSTGAAAGSASGHLQIAYNSGSTALNVVLDSTTCPFETRPDVANPDLLSLIVGSGATQETFTAITAAAPVGNVQTITLNNPSSLANFQGANTVVTQDNVTCSAPTSPYKMSSPGTISAKVKLDKVSQPTVRAGRNNEPAGNLTVAESQPSLLTTGTKMTFTIATDGVVFSTTPTAAVNVGGDLVLSGSTPPALSADRKSLTVTVSAASLTKSTVTISNIQYDLATTVPAGTKVTVTLSLSNGVAVDPTAGVSNAVVKFAIVPTAAQPTIYIGENGQATGMITFTESGAGFFTDSTGSANKFWVCVDSGETFTNAPYAIVSGGDLKLLATDGTAVTSAKGRPLGGTSQTCYFWSVYSKSTTASTVQIVGAAADGSALAAGVNNGPLVNVPSWMAPGTTQMSLHLGTILSVTGLPTTDTVFGSVANAIRAFRNQLKIAALSQPTVAPGAIGAKAGDLKLTETQLGQLDAGATICVEVVPRGSTSFVQAKQDVFFTGATTSGLPIITTNGTASGLLASSVGTFRQEFCAGDTNFGSVLTAVATSFEFDITQGSVSALGEITISNITYTALADAANGPVQVNVFVDRGSGIQESQGFVTNALIGNPVAIANGSALGVTTVGPFTSSTKVAKLSKYITWRLSGGAALAGKTVEIWVATKTGTTWSAFTKLTTRIADGSGNAFFNWRSSSAKWVSVRGVYAGSMSPARQGRWTT